MRKNKFSFIALVVLMAFVGLSGCAKREIKNINSRGTNIICFGDSITWGYGANPGEDYPSVLAKMTNIPVINAGIDGDTSTEALKRIESDVLDRDPLLVVIEFGGNDFLRKIPKEETLENIKNMVEQIQRKGAMVAIVDISSGMLLGEYHALFLRLSQEKNTVFIPRIYSGIITNPKFKSDFIHPNANGYNMIAQRIYRSILPFLDQNIILRQAQK